MFGLCIVIAILFTTYNKSLTSPQIVTNVVDVNKIKQISPFRSCSGHTVIPQNGRETKRNMKHYFNVLPEFNQEETVEIYAPYDGSVGLIRTGTDKFEGELWIAQDRGLLSFLPPIGLWMVNFEHIRPRPDLKYGTRVKAGELIGHGSFYVYKTGSFDVLYATIGFPPKKVDNWLSPFGDLDSIFNHMSDNVFAEYQQKGVTKENIIISRDVRDRNPCVYRDAGPYFEADNNLSVWVNLQ